ALEIRGHRRSPLRLDGRLRHAAGVVVADLAQLRRGPRLRRVLENVAQDGVVAILQLVEASVARPVGGDGIVLDPPAARELVEVAAGIRGLVERRQIDTRAAERHLRYWILRPQ